MLKTNYKKVSKVYDKNKTRTAFAKDNALEELLSQKEEITVLDLACGTENWLLSQQTYFEDFQGLKRIELEIANGEKEYKDVISFLDIKCEKS